MIDFETITSRDNKRLVTARKIRDGGIRDKIFIEGRRLVEESLRSALVLTECFVIDGFKDSHLVASVAERTDSVFEIPERIFNTIADTKNSQGIVVIADRPVTDTSVINLRLEKSGLPVVIYLKEINNPSNLGAIFRTAEAVDVAGVIISKDSADVFSPKALRASMGASFRLPVWEHVDLSKALNWANQMGLVPTASDIAAKTVHFQLDWKVPRLLIFGSEAHGLSVEELSQVTERIKLPMENGVESLNLAVSVGIALYEAKRQNS